MKNTVLSSLTLIPHPCPQRHPRPSVSSFILHPSSFQRRAGFFIPHPSSFIPLLMLDRETIRRLVERALDEDLPDITTEAIFEATDRGKAEFVIKSPGVIAGLEFAELTFASLDS